MRGLISILFAVVSFLSVATEARAQVVVEKTVASDLTIPDNGTSYSLFSWTNAGLSSISGTQVTGNFLQTDANNPIVLGQYSSALRFEQGTTNGITNSVFGANGLTFFNQTFALGSGFNSAVLAGTNSWALFVTDTQGGGVGKLDSWKLALEGTAAGAGSTLDLSQGGTLRVASSASATQTVGDLATGAAGNAATVEAGSGKTLDVVGVVSGAGNLTKSGAGMVILSGSSANSHGGATTVNAGTLKLNKTTGAAIAGSSIAVNTGGTLLLGAANQIADTTAVTLGGGVLDTGGFADAAGKLTVSASSTIQGLNGTSDFTFSDIDLSTYSGSGGSVLTLLGSGGNAITSGSVIRISSSNYTGWSGYDTTSFNNFQSKISFNDPNLQAQISFNSTSGLTYVTAIPEPKVYMAAAGLVILITFAEVRRRKHATYAGA